MISHVAGVVQYIKALTTNPVVNGITPPPLPAKVVFPHVTVLKVIGSELESLEGPSGLYRSIMQVNCWSKSYEEADALREQIKGWMLGGPVTPMGDLVVSGPINHSLDSELYDADREIHQCISRYLIWWEGGPSVVNLTSYDLSAQTGITITLPGGPSSVFFALFRNGMRLINGTDYTRVGVTVTLALPMIAGETLIADF